MNAVKAVIIMRTHTSTPVNHIMSMTDSAVIILMNTSILMPAAVNTHIITSTITPAAVNTMSTADILTSIPIHAPAAAATASTAERR